MSQILRALILVLSLVGASPKGVSVKLKSNWDGTSLLAEAAEFLWEEDPVLMWKFVEQWTPTGGKNCWRQLFSVARDGLESVLKEQVFLAAMAFRMYSPRVEARRHINNRQPFCCWVEIENHAFTNLDEMMDFVNSAQINQSTIELLDLDFEYGTNKQAPIVVLYAPIGSNCFQGFHSALKAASDGDRLRYVFRPVVEFSSCPAGEMHPCASLGMESKVDLGGFSVELALKKTEYITINEAPDSDSPTEARPDGKDQDDVKVKDLGLQLTQHALRSENPLETLASALEDFPSMANQLSTLNVDQDLAASVKTVSRILPSIREFGLMNGLPFMVSDIEFFFLFDKLENELEVFDALRKLGIDRDAVAELLRLRALENSDELNEIRYDILPKNVIFFNNVEKDKEYKQFYKSMEILFTPVASRGIIPIRRNLFNFVYFVDLDSKEGRDMIEFADQVLARAPLRMGVVPMLPSFCVPGADDKTSRRKTELLLRLNAAVGTRAGLEFLVKTNDGYDMDWVFKVMLDEHSKDSSSSADDFDVDRELKSLSDWAREKGICDREGRATLWLNGIIVDISDKQISSLSLYSLNNEVGFVQRAYYNGKIRDNEEDLLKSILEGQPTFKKFSRLASPDQSESEHIFLKKDHFEGAVLLRGDTSLKPVTHLVVGHLGSRVGVDVLSAAISFVSGGTTEAQVAIKPTFGDAYILRALWSENLPDDPSRVLLWQKLLDAASSTDKANLISNSDEAVEAIKDLVDRINDSSYDSKLKWVGSIRTKEKEISFPELNSSVDLKTEVAIVSNGRAIFPKSKCGPDPDCREFTSDDFEILQSISADFELGRKVYETLQNSNSTLNSNSRDTSFRVAIAASILKILGSQTRTNQDAITIQNLFKRLDSKIKFETKTDNAGIDIEVLVDPLSSTAQKLIPLLRFLVSILPINLSVYLYPKLTLDDQPLKQYQRWALPEINFSDDGLPTEVIPPSADFAHLPENKILTLNPETPFAWLIELLDAPLDLDNLKLSLFSDSILNVEYGLESLLLTGSCIDLSTTSRSDYYPRGLQLTLGREKDQVEMDTLVMSNLGYFQLKANPGRWYLNLASGRSQELYSIHEETEMDQSLRLETSSTLSFILDGFNGKVIFFKVEKRPGKELEDVLDFSSSRDSTGISAKVLKWMGVNKHPSVPTASSGDSNWKNCEFRDDPVNIFTIASGHMYERLQKIMILSVLRHTKSCVKFWFIKNYMSPQIKDFLPLFAKEYNFEYELVTYKWPVWLNSQTEKQRIIWAYKILFLDVLFPLDTRKVLFLDSDQIIRTDIRELYDMNIGRAPLAYTPFCDNNKEMDGFRFWKGGFWKAHLMGKPYHISALYVVDLVKFRQSAAGDYLRVVYEKLSNDPNSLANLDQDLPNYTQHDVPIFSLPQEWLWCETWCGNSTKHLAKTIDLCNNPLTKEPKLQSARRIVSEWSDYDKEAQRLEESLGKETSESVEITDGDDKTEL